MLNNNINSDKELSPLQHFSKNKKIFYLFTCSKKLKDALLPFNVDTLSKVEHYW